MDSLRSAKQTFRLLVARRNIKQFKKNYGPILSGNQKEIQILLQTLILHWVILPI